ncbi:MAG: hypothetical protein ACRD6X_18695, partial [Pyrinomonadaceae bacterium]
MNFAIDRTVPGGVIGYAHCVTGILLLNGDNGLKRAYLSFNFLTDNLSEKFAKFILRNKNKSILHCCYRFLHRLL